MNSKFNMIIIACIILVNFISMGIKSENNFLMSVSRDVGKFNILYESANFFNEETNRILINSPRIFTENQGQLENDNVRFYVQGGGIWFTGDGVWFELREYVNSSFQRLAVSYQGDLLPMERPKPPEYKPMILKQEFVGANDVRLVGRERVSWNSNFFYGNDPSKWYTEVPNFREVYYENLYDGIDLRYYTKENGLKYDFIVHPGANINQIRIRYKGADELVTDESGNLIIKTPIEDNIDGNLFIYQDYSGLKKSIDGRFEILNKYEYGFQILDDYNHQEDLIIDPLIYSTYIGGTDVDVANAIGVDSIGNTYIMGFTNSINFPTTPGSFDTISNASSSYWDRDIIMFKFNPNGSIPIYSTYIGDNGVDEGNDIVIDPNGCAYITGWTTSNNFPTTPNAFDRSFNDNISISFMGGDCFVLKLNQNGSSLIYSTYIGAEDMDKGTGIKVDTFGNAYIAGYTYNYTLNPYNFPTTPGAYDNLNYQAFDGFIIKLNANGSTLLYSTFIGGNSMDYIRDIAIDSKGNAYVTGLTGSLDFPNTTGAYDNSCNATINTFDSFVLKLNLSGSGTSDLLYSTYIGGSKDDECQSITVDLNGNIIVTGFTNSSDFPTTIGAYDTSFNGEIDTFIFILKPIGSGKSDLLYSTFLGSFGNDLGIEVSIDSIGYVYVAGHTNSLDFPTTADAYDKYCKNYDIFISIFSHNLTELIYSTFIGGSDDEKGYQSWVDKCGIGLFVDNDRNIYITGNTSSEDFPTTPGAFNMTSSGKSDIFVLKFCLRDFLEINSFQLLKDNIPKNIAYSKLGTYTFRVKLVDTISSDDLRSVRLTLDTPGTNIQLFWDHDSGTFTKKFDPNNYIILEQSSKAYNDSLYIWTLDFNVTFNWTYPQEDFNDVQVYATSTKLSPAWLNISKFYRVENDLVFNGTLSVKNENNQTLKNNDLVKGGEILNWTGLRPIYENSTDIFPPANEFDITIWDSNNNGWSVSPAAGENFTLKTITAPNTNLDGDIYIINISGIPPECDKTNESFVIRIDGDNITFSNPKPDNKTWQTGAEVEIGITITDHGGGLVDGKNITYSISNDNGTSWEDWISIEDNIDETSIDVQTLTIFEDGKNNLVKWQAIDTVGNGPVISSEYRVLVDTEEVRFSNPWPLKTFESPTQNIEVGINISDNMSGVNAQSIEYSILLDMGKLWSSWNPVPILTNGTNIVVRLDLFFPNGTNNYIKWRASDIAGNGPTESKVYQIKVNTWLQTLIPKVELLNPANGSIIPSTSVEISWFLMNKNLVGVEYDLFLDTINPPITRRGANLTDTHFTIFDLIDGETYYWTVIPKLEDETGWCDSGVWSFSINTSVPFPKVQLISPENNSIITSPKPTLLWSLGYDGTEKVIYNVYLDTNENPIEYEKSENTYYLTNRILEDNTTYYWKVIPMAGNVTGPSSPIWRFTVKKGYVPSFGLKLELEPRIVGVKPGGITYAKAKVTNLGEITDSVLLNIKIPPDKDVGAMVNEPITIDLEPGRIGIFNITVTATEDIKQNEVILTIIATSEKAKELGKTVEARETLTVKIIRTEEPGEDKSTTEQNLWIFLLIVMIIIIVIIILFIVLKRKKRAKEELLTSETVTIKPMESPELEKPQEQLSPTPTIAQHPTIFTSESEKKAVTTGTSAPELLSPSTESLESTPQQIPQVEPAPQLPPAQPQIATTESEDETPTPTQTPSTEISGNSTQSDEFDEDPP